MKINCLIIDDEQWARDLLESYITRISGLQVLGKCKHTAEAKVQVEKNEVHLLLLDINMPNQSGIDFLKSMGKPPKVIFTTAYAKYALEGYNLEVVDYLLKPISFERFQKAIQKAKLLIEMTQKVIDYEATQKDERQSIVVKEGYDLHKIYIDEILYVSAMREYVQYHLDDKKIMSLASLTAVEKSLPSGEFIRIHRSYLVAKKAVSTLKKNIILLQDNTELPLGKTYKNKVQRFIF